MQQISDSDAGRMVVAFDRPPFGLTERPLSWEGGSDADPYTCKGALANASKDSGNSPLDKCACGLLYM